MNLVKAAVERGYFALCVGAGRALRATRYSTARIVTHDGADRVHKRRLFYAPLLVWMSAPLVRVLDTGVRFLPAGEWAERERNLYDRVYRSRIHVDRDGHLLLPRLPGTTLADLLDDPDLVDLDARAARWFDFETVHESSKSRAWCRADDLRALLATCLLRTSAARVATTVKLVLDTYADEEVIGALTASFDSVLRRPLAFHLAQATLPLGHIREIDRLLRRRSAVDGSVRPRADADLRRRWR